MAFNPTEAQQNIYNFVENGTGNGIIDAVAGAGKTTTLMGCVQHIKNPQDALFCAFNTSIRKEIQRKFHDMGKIQEISDRVGYMDVKYFSRQFKADTGQTPAQYRLEKRQ